MATITVAYHMTPTDFLVELKRLEMKLRRATVPIAAPPSVYQKFKEIRNELADWALECVLEEKKVEDKYAGPANESHR